MSEVVLLGHLVRPRAWAAVLPLVESEHDVTFLDVPGFGDTPIPEGVVTSIPGLGAAVADEVVRRGQTDAHLVGISMAGSVALEAARTGKVSSATAISPPGFWSALEVTRIMATIGSLYSTSLLAGPLLELAGRSRRLRTQVWREVTAHPERLPDEVADEMILGVARNMRGLMRPKRLLPAVRAVAGYRTAPLDGSVPVTVAWGDQDTFTSFRDGAARAREVLPQARHVTLTDCGHIPLFDDPEQVAGVILDTVSAADA